VGSLTTVRINQRRFAPTSCPHHRNQVPTSTEYAPDTHPFKDRVRVSARDLAGETIYWLPRRLHPPLYDEVKNYLLGMGHRVQDLHEARAIIQGIDVAAHGFGVALVPRSAERFQCAHVLFKPLTDKLIGIETALFVRRDSIHGEVGDFVNAAIAKLRPPKTEVQ